MLKNMSRIGVIGGGNMGEAFASALIKSGIRKASEISVSDIDESRLSDLHRTYGVSVHNDNRLVFSRSDVVILAVKPQQMIGVLTGIAGHPGYSASERKLIISIAAGIPMKKIESVLYTPLAEADRMRLPIIRVMPNTPALVLMGVSGMSANRFAGDDERTLARQLLSAIGTVFEFEEEDLDAVTALSGSGPAYVFYLIESMIDAGIAVGLPSDKAIAMTLETVKGSLSLMTSRSTSAEELRRQVTSPGGTTEAALQVLEANHVKDHIIDAIKAARRRGKELSSLM